MTRIISIISSEMLSCWEARKKNASDKQDKMKRDYLIASDKCKIIFLCKANLEQLVLRNPAAEINDNMRFQTRLRNSS